MTLLGMPPNTSVVFAILVAEALTALWSSARPVLMSWKDTETTKDAIALAADFVTTRMVFASASWVTTELDASTKPFWVKLNVLLMHIY